MEEKTPISETRNQSVELVAQVPVLEAVETPID